MLFGLKYLKKFESDFIDGLKKEILLFDRVGIPYLGDHIKTLGKYKNSVYYASEVLNEVDYLQEKGLLFDSTKNLSTEERSELFKIMLKSALDLVPPSDEENLFDILVDDNFINPFTRRNCQLLDEKDTKNRYVNLFSEFERPFVSITNEDYLYRILLSNFPIPSETTSWEDILYFKKDDFSNEKLLRLRNWVNDLKYRVMTYKEIEEIIHHSLAEYEKSLNLHRIQHHVGILEIIVTGGAEIFEDMIKLRITNLSKKMFGITKIRANLLAQEMNTPGKEIAYISRLRKK